MIRFSSLEELGVRVACMSDKGDGDCGVKFDGGGAILTGDRGRFCATVGIADDEVRYIRQVHGVDVIRVRDAARGGGVGGADGLMGEGGDAAMGITVADCVPVFLYDPVSKAGGLVHAGREGTFGNIAGHAMAALEKTFGVSAGRVWAVIGPSAGPCCYEVSEELAKAFRERGLPIDGRKLDLWRGNVGQLVGAGVPENQIEVCGVCTICGTAYHSHRATGDGARNLAILAL